jgi:hypothetical protein
MDKSMTQRYDDHERRVGEQDARNEEQDSRDEEQNIREVEQNARDADIDARLQDHLQRAHNATEIARIAIERITEELRFPLASSTRVRDDL